MSDQELLSLSEAAKKYTIPMTTIRDAMRPCRCLKGESAPRRRPLRQECPQRRHRVMTRVRPGHRRGRELPDTAPTGRKQPSGVSEPRGHDFGGRAQTGLLDHTGKIRAGDKLRLVQLELLQHPRQSGRNPACHIMRLSIEISYLCTYSDTMSEVSQ